MGMEAMDPRARERHQAFMLQSAAMVSRDEEITLDRARLRGAVLDGMKTAKDIGRELGWMPSRGKTVAMPPVTCSATSSAVTAATGSPPPSAAA